VVFDFVVIMRALARLGIVRARPKNCLLTARLSLSVPPAVKSRSDGLAPSLGGDQLSGFLHCDAGLVPAGGRAARGITDGLRTAVHRLDSSGCIGEWQRDPR